MLNYPEWQKMLIEISKGRNIKNEWKGSYSRQLLIELERQGFIKIERGMISLTEMGSGVVYGVSGFLERL